MITRCIGLIVACIIAGNALAGGFQLFEQSVKGLGSAFSDQATSTDASTAFWNPAGLVRLHGHHISLLGHVIKPTGHFVDTGSRTTYSTAAVGTTVERWQWRRPRRVVPATRHIFFP